MTNSVVLVLVLTLGLSSCITFSQQDICSRDTEVAEWISATTSRVQVINTDSNLTSADIENLYHDQQNEETPACLYTAQQHAERSFLLQWEAAKAMEDDNIAGSLPLLAQSRLASAQLSKEVDRLAELNDW